MQTPIKLTAMTLRGIGSYFHGARLEIRPITILCGKNGSGKSTWFKALNLLVDAHRSGRLPFHFSSDSGDSADIRDTNARVFLTHHTDEELDRYARNPEVIAFGNLGTIGLEFEVAEDLDLQNASNIKADSCFVPQSFLWHGQARKGTRIRLRFTDPTIVDGDSPPPHLVLETELQLNGEHLIRWTRPYPQLNPNSNAWQYGTTKLTCSQSFLPGMREDSGTMIEIDSNVGRSGLNEEVIDNIGDADPRQILELQAIRRIGQLLDMFFSGYFYISAIRLPHTSDDLEEATESEASSFGQSVFGARHVGVQGANAWLLEDRFASHAVRPCFSFSKTGCRAYTGDEIVTHKALVPKLLNKMREEPVAGSGDCWQHLFKLLPADCKEKLRSIGRDTSDIDNIAKNIAAAFNFVLENRALLQNARWPYIDPEVSYLLEKNVESLTVDELRQRNRKLIDTNIDEIAGYLEWNEELKRMVKIESEEANRYAKACHKRAVSDFGYLFEGYVSFWLEKLTGAIVKCNFPSRGAMSLAEIWNPGSIFLNGFVTEENTAKVTRDEDNARRIGSPFFGYNAQPPRQMSSGFHQLAPIIVQIGLMQRNEVVAIENPEVHLHPSLQLETAEYFLNQAQSGRNILLETHSDLIIRRVMRAILDETIAQKDVRIYFASARQDKEFLTNSSLELLRTNAQGQIDNWPEGFMDDDMKENQRLMHIMYGTPYKDEEEWQ
jgi:predicted ATPase